MKIRFIGDVHSKFDAYLPLIEVVEKSIQVGDMGIGFGIDMPIISPDHKFIRGNHDNLFLCRKSPNFIKDGTFWKEESIFFIGGAWSIDYEWRQQYEMSTGIKIWWADEECSYKELQKFIGLYEKYKPRIMVTHDSPTILAEKLSPKYDLDKSRTRLAFDNMFDIHKPDIWICGHWHVSRREEISGTEFIVLNELEVVDLEI